MVCCQYLPRIYYKYLHVFRKKNVLFFLYACKDDLQICLIKSDCKKLRLSSYLLFSPVNLPLFVLSSLILPIADFALFQLQAPNLASSLKYVHKIFATNAAQPSLKMNLDTNYLKDVVQIIFRLLVDRA